MNKLPALLQRIKLQHPIRLASKSAFQAYDAETNNKYTLNILALPRSSQFYEKMLSNMTISYENLTTITNQNIEAPDAFARHSVKTFGPNPDEFFLVLWPHYSISLNSVIQVHIQHKTLFKESEIIDFLKRAAGGLSAVHKIDVFHSNLHDQNVFFGDDLREPVITEFIHPFHPSFHNPNYFKTAHRSRIFMSPEYRDFLVKGGQSDLGGDFYKKNDLFALGVLALKMAILRDINEDSAREALTKEHDFLKKNYPKLMYILNALIPQKLKNVVTVEELYTLLTQVEKEVQDNQEIERLSPEAFSVAVKEQTKYLSNFVRNQALGFGYRCLGDYSDSIVHYELARDNTNDIDEKINMYEELAKTHYNKDMLKSTLNDLQKASDLLPQSKKDQTTKKLRLLIEQAICNYYRKDVAQALRLASEAIKLSNKHHIKNAELILACLYILDKCQAEVKEFDKALSTSKEILETTRKTFGEDSILTVKALHNLSNCYETVNDMANCLKYSHEAISIMEDHDLNNNNLLGNLYKETADVQYKTKTYGLALENYQKAVEILGTEEKSELLLEIYNKAANTCFKIEPNSKEGYEFLQKAIDVSHEIHGEQSEQYFNAMTKLASVYEIKGEYENALQLRQENLQEMLRIYGDAHPYVAWSQAAVGKILKKKGAYKQAIEYFQQAYEIIHENNLEKDLELQSAVFFDLGCCLLNTHKFKEALTILKQALEAESKLHPETSSRLAEIEWHLGLAQSKAGTLQEALKTLLQALEDSKKSVNDLKLASRYIYVAQIMLNLRQYQQAIDLLNKNILSEKNVDAKQTKVEGTANVLFAHALEVLGDGYLKDEEETLAKHYFLKAKKIFSKYEKNDAINRLDDKIRVALNEEDASTTDEDLGQSTSADEAEKESITATP